MVVSPIALSATATEHGWQLVSAVDWTLRLLCKMCVCGFANCASVALQIVQHTHTLPQNLARPTYSQNSLDPLYWDGRLARATRPTGWFRTPISRIAWIPFVGTDASRGASELFVCA